MELRLSFFFFFFKEQREVEVEKNDSLHLRLFLAPPSLFFALFHDHWHFPVDPSLPQGKAGEPGGERSEKAERIKVRSREKERGRSKPLSSGGFMFFHALPPSFRARKRRFSPPPSFFSSHERKLPLLPRAPIDSGQRVNNGRGSERGGRRKHQSLEGRKRKTVAAHLSLSLNSDTALPPPATHRSDPSSPARRASSSAERLDWRATRSAAAMENVGVV